MGTSRRPRTSGSETNDFITQGSANTISFVVMSVPLAFPARANGGDIAGSAGRCLCSELVSQLKDPVLRKFQGFTPQAIIFSLPLRKTFLLYWTAIKHALYSWRETLSSKAILYRNMLEMVA